MTKHMKKFQRAAALGILALGATIYPLIGGTVGGGGSCTTDQGIFCAGACYDKGGTNGCAIGIDGTWYCLCNNGPIIIS